MRRTCTLVLVTVSCSWMPPVLQACSSSVGPDGWRRVVGHVNLRFTGASTLEVPEEAVAGVPFTATVRTVGSSTCTREDGAEVEMQGATAIITPYDRVAPPGTPCTRDLGPFPREVEIRFDVPGNARVRVVGRTSDGLSIAHQVTVVVRPAEG